jgi:hypothetical protein
MMQKHGKVATDPAQKAYSKIVVLDAREHQEHQSFTRQDETLVLFDLSSDFDLNSDCSRNDGRRQLDDGF